MKMKSVLVAVSTAACLSAFVGFAKFNSGSQTSVASAAVAYDSPSQSHLQKVLKSGVLTVGSILSYPPFGLTDTHGNPGGYDVDVARLLAKSMHVKLKVVDVTSDARIPALVTGKVDAIFGNFAMTLDRAQVVEFSNPYTVSGLRLLVKKSSGIQSTKDLAGKKVAVIKGSTNVDVVKQYAPKAQMSFYASPADCVLAVKNGQADAYVEDSSFLQYQAKLNPSLSVVGPTLGALEYQGVGVPMGDQEWLNYINHFIFVINTDGENQALFKKWFGAYPQYKFNPSY